MRGCSFNKELNQDQILFVVYILYLAVVYLLIWLRFANDIQDELWRTKSVLGILDPELVMSIAEIREFIIANSSTVFFAKGGRS